LWARESPAFARTAVEPGQSLDPAHVLVISAALSVEPLSTTTISALRGRRIDDGGCRIQTSGDGMGAVPGDNDLYVFMPLLVLSRRCV
jgi:hypothetical protein